MGSSVIKMGWRELLQQENETVVLPWTGGRSLHSHNQRWDIEGTLPREYDWYTFNIKGRKVVSDSKSSPDNDILKFKTMGYLVGDHFAPDNIAISPKLSELAQKLEQVYLIEPGLDKFARVSAGRIYEDGPLVFNSQEFPAGPEDKVLDAFLNEKDSTDDIANIFPALDVAFRVETWRRAEATKRRQEEQERRNIEERMQRLRDCLGDGALRREMAKDDFEAAARAALLVGGATYLDHRKAYNRNEMVVRFRLNRRRFECTCDAATLRIIDSGICLTDHDTGEKGDTYFTLESLPAVIQEAQREGVLVVFRHVD